MADQESILSRILSRAKHLPLVFDNLLHTLRSLDLKFRATAGIPEGASLTITPSQGLRGAFLLAHEALRKEAHRG